MQISDMPPKLSSVADVGGCPQCAALKGLLWNFMAKQFKPAHFLKWEMMWKGEWPRSRRWGIHTFQDVNTLLVGWVGVGVVWWREHPAVDVADPGATVVLVGALAAIITLGIWKKKGGYRVGDQWRSRGENMRRHQTYTSARWLQSRWLTFSFLCQSKTLFYEKEEYPRCGRKRHTSVTGDTTLIQ